jgi:hypothetical protein
MQKSSNIREVIQKRGNLKIVKEQSRVQNSISPEFLFEPPVISVGDNSYEHTVYISVESSLQ